MGQKHHGAASGSRGTGARGSQQTSIMGSSTTRKNKSAITPAHPKVATKPALKVHPRQGPSRNEMHS